MKIKLLSTMMYSDYQLSTLSENEFGGGVKSSSEIEKSRVLH